MLHGEYEHDLGAPEMAEDQNAHDRVGRWVAQHQDEPIPVPQGESATAEDGEIRPVNIGALEGVREA